MKRGKELEYSMMRRWYVAGISRQSMVGGKMNDGDSEWTAANASKVMNVN